MTTIREQAIEAMVLGIHIRTANEKRALNAIKTTIEQATDQLYQHHHHAVKNAINLTLLAQAVPPASMRQSFASMATLFDKQLLALNQTNAMIKNELAKKAEPELEVSSFRNKF